LLQGKVIKAAGGFFTVRDQTGGEYLCRARGALKKGRQSLIVGDRVVFEPVKSSSADYAGEGVIEEVLPRNNCLPRPPVANVDRLIVIMSLKNPGCDWQLVSRMAVLAEKENLSLLICFNKTDLLTADELNELTGRINAYPYPVILTSAVSGKGINHLKAQLTGQCSVLAGPSGVGKSTLLNSVQPGLFLQTGTVSEKIKRGRHTTRQVSLLSLEEGGSVVDTPGFTRLDFFDIEPEQLPGFFPEFETLQGYCGFRDCLHINEPNCAVKPELGKTLAPMRYEHYKYFLEELDRQEAH